MLELAETGGAELTLKEIEERDKASELERVRRRGLSLGRKCGEGRAGGSRIVRLAAKLAHTGCPHAVVRTARHTLGVRRHAHLRLISQSGAHSFLALLEL